jgi:hypothetical protein
MFGIAGTIIAAGLGSQPRRKKQRPAGEPSYVRDVLELGATQTDPPEKAADEETAAVASAVADLEG